MQPALVVHEKMELRLECNDSSGDWITSKARTTKGEKFIIPHNYKSVGLNFMIKLLQVPWTDMQEVHFLQ